MPAMNPSDIDPLDQRDARALTECMTVLDSVGRARHAGGLYLVVSESGKEYLVDVIEGACECADFRNRGKPCKHLKRVQFATGRRPIPAWVNRDAVDENLGSALRNGVPRWEGRDR